MDAIHLQDLAFYAYHGVHAEEARLGQRFQVDLTCHVDLSEASASGPRRSSAKLPPRPGSPHSFEST